MKAIACVHPKFFIGCRAGKTTKFAVLDIDSGSKYHDKPQLDRLLKVLSDAGLSRSSLYRSSYSDGWHLYLFFDEWISSADLHRHLVRLLTLNDFDVAKGTLEIFPNRTNRHSTGMGLRLPLQPGFAWLDKRDLDIDCERAEVSPTKALEMFLDALESDANPYSSFRNLKTYNDKLEARKAKAHQQGDSVPTNVVAIRRTADILQPSEYSDFVKAVFQKLPPGIIADNWYKGRLFHLYGLAAPSQRAEAITSIGHYFFYGDPSRNLPAMGYGYEQDREWAIEKFLAARHNGQSKDINHGRPDAIAQVARAANWRPAHAKDKQTTKYAPERPISWIKENDNRKKDARQRIQQALDTLKKQQRAFTTVELRDLAQCSRETLYNHQDIWRSTYEDRKDYRDLSAGFFANCTDEYNDVVGADSSQIKPPSTPHSKITPPGLLAARRIVYELSVRGKRDIQRAEKEARQSRDAQESSWMREVADLQKIDLSTMSIPKLKALMALLSHYLSLSPNKEAEDSLRGHLIILRARLDSLIQSARLLPDSG